MTHRPGHDSETEKKQKKKGGSLLGWAVAATIAAGAGILLTTRMMNNNSQISDRAKNLGSKFNKSRKDIQDVVRNTFGEVRDDLEESYVSIKGHLMAGADEARNKGNFARKDYDKMVDDTVNRFSKGRGWSTDSIKKLSKNLKSDWSDMQSDMKGSKKQTAKSSR